MSSEKRTTDKEVKEVKVKRGRPRRKAPGREEAVKEEGGCLRRRGCHRAGELRQQERCERKKR